MAAQRASRWLRLLVVGLQVCGIFVHTWPQKGSTPRSSCSALLCLWALFIRLWMAGSLFVYGAEKFDSAKAGNIGDIAVMTTLVSAAGSFTIGPMFLLAKSKGLSVLIVQLQDTIGTKTSANIARKIVYILIFYIAVCATFTGSMFFSTTIGSMDISSGILVSAFIIVIIMSVSLVIEVFHIMVELMAHEILETSLQTKLLLIPRHLEQHSTDPPSLIGDLQQRFRGEREDPKVDMAIQLCSRFSEGILRQLERKIYQVALLRECVVKLFFQTLSLVFLSFTTSGITSLFLMLTDLEHAKWIGVYSVISLTHFSRICTTGETFAKKMDESALMMREVSLVCADIAAKAQVQSLISYLGAQRDFDMNGWYILNYRTLISVLSFMATYLVILLQVARHPLDAI